MRLTGLLLVFVAFAGFGCRDSAEFFGFTGSPAGDDGWSHDYNATTHDTWEAFRLIVKDNGTITSEDPDNMELEGVYKPHDSSERDGINIRGKVYDKSKPDELRSRLIIHAWYARSANDAERPHTAREYCNTVFRVLKQWKGEDIDEDPRVDAGSDNPVLADEAVGYFRVSPADVLATCEGVVRQYGEIEQLDADKGFIRGNKKNPLEKETQEVRISVYDRTEGERVRSKVSVRVRGADDKPLQEVSKAYIAAIRDELQKKYGVQE
jgi:hypothetical protein